MNVVVAIADDRSICESLRAALPPESLLLIESTVEDALRQLVTVPADAIILDDAPRLGLGALRTLVDELPSVAGNTPAPIIVLSAKGDVDVRATYITAGAKHCLVKPFSCDELVAAIDDCVSRTIGPVEKSQARAPSTESGNASAIQYQTALRWMGRNLAHIEDVSRLTHSLVEAAVDIFHLSRAALLLQTNGSVRVNASFGVPDAVAGALRLSFSSGLMRHLEENACLVDKSSLVAGDSVVKEMNALGGRLALPLMSGGRVCGALVVGNKTLWQDFTIEERELLTVMVRSASLFLEKSRRYHDVAKQQSRLDAVLANITAGVVTVGQDKTVTMMNESAERILKLGAPDVLGRSVQKLGSQFANIVLTTLSEGEPRTRQRFHDAAIGADLGLSVTPLGPEGVVVIFSVIPEIGEGGGAKYDPVWEYLSSRMAQEIKNPMVAINTFAQLLPKKHSSKEFREEFAEVVQGEVARINGVVETLFEFAASPRLDLHKSPLRESVEEVLASFDEDLKSRSIELETRYEDDIEVEIDPQLFSRALKNVLQNSIEAMPEGGTLTIVTKKENGSCELRVSDTGEGIGEDAVQHIFAPFYSTKETGMGLGLTIADKILHQLNGNLECVNGTKNGGVFAIHLPTAKIEH